MQSYQKFELNALAIESKTNRTAWFRGFISSYLLTNFCVTCFTLYKIKYKKLFVCGLFLNSGLVVFSYIFYNNYFLEIYISKELNTIAS